MSTQWRVLSVGLTASVAFAVLPATPAVSHVDTSAPGRSSASPHDPATGRISGYSWKLPGSVDRRSTVKSSVKFDRAHKGRKAEIQLKSSGGWSTVDKGKENRSGRIRFSFSVIDAGKYKVRVKFKSKGSARGGTSPTRKLRVVTPVRAVPDGFYLQGTMWFTDYTVGDTYAYWLPTTGERKLDNERYLAGLDFSTVEWTSAGSPEDPRLIGHFSVRRPASGLTPESYDLGLVVVNPRSNKVERVIYYSKGLTDSEVGQIYPISLGAFGFEPIGSDISTTVLVQGMDHGASGPLVYSVNYVTGAVVWKTRGLLEDASTRIAAVAEPQTVDCERVRGIRIADGTVAFTVTPVTTGGCSIGSYLFGSDLGTIDSGTRPEDRYFWVGWTDNNGSHQERWFDGASGASMSTAEKAAPTQVYDSLGRTLASYSYDGEIRVRDAFSGALLYQLSAAQSNALDAGISDLYNRILYLTTTDESLAVNVDTDTAVPGVPPIRRVTPLPGYWTYYANTSRDYVALDR